MSEPRIGDSLLDRMVRAVHKVQARLLRATAVLDSATVTYAVIGDAAVAAWVARVDEAAVRNAKEIELLVRPGELHSAADVLVKAGFVQASPDAGIFLDYPGDSVRHALRLVISGQKTRPDDLLAAPDVSESERFPSFQVVNLEALVRMKLSSFRTVDRMHLEDLLDVGLIDGSWSSRYPQVLGSRLGEIVARR